MVVLKAGQIWKFAALLQVGAPFVALWRELSGLPRAAPQRNSSNLTRCTAFRFCRSSPAFRKHRQRVSTGNIPFHQRRRLLSACGIYLFAVAQKTDKSVFSHFLPTTTIPMRPISSDILPNSQKNPQHHHIQLTCNDEDT